MSAKATFWAWEQKGISSTCKLVLLCLSNCHNDSNNRCYPSINYIVKNTGLNKKTIISCIEKLSKSELITANKTLGKSTAYEFNFSLTVDLTSTEIGTSAKNGTSTEIGTTTGTEIGTTPVPKLVPEPKRNLKDNLKERYICEKLGIEVSLPEEITHEVFNQFIQHRKSLKKANKKITLSQSVAKRGLKVLLELSRSGENISACIEQSEYHGWTDIYPIKNNQGGQGDAKKGKRQTRDEATRSDEQRIADLEKAARDSAERTGETFDAEFTIVSSGCVD